MALTAEMKREIIAYCFQYTKGVIEDADSCPLVANAYDRGEIDEDIMERFVDSIREDLLERFQ